jgi:hypothetical protein
VFHSDDTEHTEHSETQKKRDRARMKIPAICSSSKCNIQATVNIRHHRERHTGSVIQGASYRERHTVIEIEGLSEIKRESEMKRESEIKGNSRIKGGGGQHSTYSFSVSRILLERCHCVIDRHHLRGRECREPFSTRSRRGK